MSKRVEINCPIRGLYGFQPCEISEIKPLLDFLGQNQAIETKQTFPRGTVLPDGRLDLCKQNLGPEGCAQVATALKGNGHIESLLLGTDGIGDEGAKSVADLVRENDSLKIIYLGCNHITAEGTRAIAKSLLENQTVRGLWLKRNPIGPDGASAIANLIETNSQIEVLDLVNTNIGKQGLGDLLNSIAAKSCGVRRLYLSGNALDGDDAQLLYEKLSVSKVESLFLSANFLGDAGALAIANLLKRNKQIREIGLASNGIESKGFQHVLASAANHPTLELLDLGVASSAKVLGATGNRIGEEGVKAAASLLVGNSRLKKLNLRGTKITSEGFELIFDAMMKNSNLISLGVDCRLPERIQQRLQQNAARNSGPAFNSPPEVRMIRSVYRTS